MWCYLLGANYAKEAKGGVVQTMWCMIWGASNACGATYAMQTTCEVQAAGCKLRGASCAKNASRY
eukprot:9475145-Pyramimonas_sp.AAC.1